MIEITGDIWTQECDAICITTNMVLRKNGQLVMGAGLALQAKNRFPKLPWDFGAYYGLYDQFKHNSHESQFAYCHAVEIGKGHPDIVAFPTKYHWRDPSDLTLIRKSAADLVALTKEMGYGKVVLPRPGTGLGRLDWNRVREIIEPYLKDNIFHIITPG